MREFHVGIEDPMTLQPSINHIALTFQDKKKAILFFCTIVGMEKVKSFELSKTLSEAIFGLSEEIDIDVFGNDTSRFEVFYTDSPKMPSFEHICLEIQDTKQFMDRCKEYGLKPFTVQKQEKILLFVRDFAQNLYEIKEK